ncbi:MAG: hypothetical protein ACOYKZ_05995 [Chlamydiia bacterium]
MRTKDGPQRIGKFFTTLAMAGIISVASAGQAASPCDGLSNCLCDKGVCTATPIGSGAGLHCPTPTAKGSDGKALEFAQLTAPSQPGGWTCLACEDSHYVLKPITASASYECVLPSASHERSNPFSGSHF